MNVRHYPLQLTASITSFISAFLLFAIQPMLGRFLLPILGGAPAVWLTVLLLFQITLALAYAYSNLLTKRIHPTTQLYIHFALMSAAFLSLPIALPEMAFEHADTIPIWLLAQIFFLSVGLPFFINASHAPLLQKWFSFTAHPRSHDPYFLYVASNAGSMTALVTYVIFFEPTYRLSEQSQLWSFGFIILATCAGLFGIMAVRQHRLTQPSSFIGERPIEEPLRWRLRLHWALLTFIPSALLHTTSLHITTDIAAVPFLWVAPLIVYLVTFIICFARKRVLFSHKVIHDLHMLSVALYGFFALILLSYTFDTVMLLANSLLLLFTSALLCHHRLNACRPKTTHLGAFYVWLAIGGALGGVFAVLIAPLIFSSLIDYPLLIIAACLLRRPQLRAKGISTRMIDGALPLFFLTISLLISFEPSLLQDGVNHAKNHPYLSFFPIFP